MFVVDYQKIDIQNSSDIIIITKNPNEKFLAILTRDSLFIRDFYNSSLILIDSFQRNNKSLLKDGFNHWIQWLNPNSLTIGTQAGLIYFFCLNENGNFISKIELEFNETITSHCSAYGALLISTKTNLLGFLSPTGEIKSKLQIYNENIIRQIYFSENILFLLFSNGNLKYSKIKQSQIIKNEPLIFQNIEIKDISFIKLFKNYLYILTFNRNLIRLQYEKLSEITLISENVSLFQITKDGNYIIFLNNKSNLLIWCSKTLKITEVILNIRNNSFYDFITSEIDYYGLRFIFATFKECFYIGLALNNYKIPSLFFNSVCSIINFNTNQTIAAPPELLMNYFPIQYSYFSNDNQYLMIAGRKNFALYFNQNWKILNLENYLCRSLWYQLNNFISIVLDSQEPKYKIILFNYNHLDILFELEIEGIFKSIDFKLNQILITLQNSLNIYEIIDDSIKLIKIINNLPLLETSSLNFDLKNYYSLTLNENNLIKYPENLIIFEGVTSIQTSNDLDILFFISHGQQFIYLKNQILRLDNIYFYFNLFNGFNIPNIYSPNNLILKNFNYLSEIFYFFLNKPEILLEYLMKFIEKEGIIDCIILFIIKSIKNFKITELNNFLNLLPQIKNHFLVSTLIKNNDNNLKDILIKLLPNFEELIQQFPNLLNQLKIIYNK